MKRGAIYLIIFFLLTTPNVVKAQLPVFDASAFAQSILTSIARIDTKIKNLVKLTALDETIAVIGDIKKGLASLASLKAKIDNAIRLANQGMSLVTQSVEVAARTIDDIKRAKELLLAPIEIGRQAVDYANQAVVFLKSSEDYATRYRETLAEAYDIINRADINELDRAKALLEEAKDLNNNSKRYLREAQTMINKAEDLLMQLIYLYRDILDLNKSIAYNQNQACMLKVKAKFFIEDFSRTFCYKPDGSKADFAAAKALCQKVDKQKEEVSQSDVCASKTKAALDRINAFDDAVSAYTKPLFDKGMKTSSATVTDMMAKEYQEKTKHIIDQKHEEMMQEANDQFFKDVTSSITITNEGE